jgi:hypothetical protein
MESDEEAREATDERPETRPYNQLHQLPSFSFSLPFPFPFSQPQFLPAVVAGFGSAVTEQIRVTVETMFVLVAKVAVIGVVVLVLVARVKIVVS